MIAVIEMGQASWLVAGNVPGLERQPLKKLGSDEQALFQLLQRWRNEAVQTGGVRLSGLWLPTRPGAMASG